MSFEKVSFDEALDRKLLSIWVGEKSLSRGAINSMTVDDLEKRASVTLFGDNVRLRKSFFNISEDDPVTQDTPICIDYSWRGVSTVNSMGFHLPKEPYLPQSNALEFLREVYISELNVRGDQGNILD